MGLSTKAVLRKKILNWLVSFTVLVLLMIVTKGPAFAEAQEPVTYMDWDEASGTLVEKTCTDYTYVTARNLFEEGDTLRDGRWYVVDGTITIDESELTKGRINVVSSANLILLDGATLNANKGIRVSVDRSGSDEEAGTLTIYGQREGTGKLNAIATDSHAGIGGNGVRDEGNTNLCDAGNIIINGGVVYAEGNVSAPGIGGGEQGKGGNVIVNHGRVTAEGRSYETGMTPAIGGGRKSDGNGAVSINKDLAVVAGESDEDLMDVTDSYAEDHTQRVVHIGDPASHTATFKVSHGKWNDKTEGDKTYTLRTVEGVPLKVPEKEFPEVGNEPDKHYKSEGSWNPAKSSLIGEDTTFTFTYDGYISAIENGSEVLRSNCNTDAAKTIRFGGNSWYVIGYDGQGPASSKGNVALLSQRNIGASTIFDDSGNVSNVYANSRLRARVDEIAQNIPDDERAVIAPRTLKSGTFDYMNTDCVAGDDVENALLWPLSTKEACELNGTLRIADPDHVDYYNDNSWWWLRSPGDKSSNATAVNGTGQAPYSGGIPVERYAYGVRPAFHVDLEDVVFTSAAADGKASGDEGPDALKEVETTTAGSWKLTVKDDSLSGFTAAVDRTADGAYPISYSGARTGQNEYVSAVIKDSEGYVIYYGRIKNLKSAEDASGTVNIDLKGKFSVGDTIHVFNEQCNGEDKTDFASDLKDVTDVCKVTFADGQGNTLKTEDVLYSFAATAPEAPAPEKGYRFKGWDKDFSHVTEDMTVTAVYEPIKVASLRFKNIPGEIDEDAEADILVSIEPADALNKTLEWSSSDESVLTVENGHVKGIKAGKASITVCTTDGSDLKRTRTITVNHVHKWGDWEVITAATEKTEGEEARVCSKCGEKETRVIPNLDHVHQITLVEETAATCTASGTMAHYECSGCGLVFADEKGETQTSLNDLRIPAVGHTAADPVKEGEETAPTCCSIGGYNLFTRCRDCGAVLTQERVDIPIDPDAHVWDEGVVTKKPTATETGTRVYTCREDPSHTKTEEIPTLVSIDGAKVVLNASGFTYNGKVLRPSIRTIGGKALKEGTDYNVKWSDASSRNVGSYTVKITGEGDYTGVAKAAYKIYPKGTSVARLIKARKAVKVKWKKQAGKMSASRITGYEIQLAVNKKFTKGRKLVTVKGYKKVSKKVTGLKAGKKYYVRVRTFKMLNGVKYRSPWSKKKTIRTR